MTYYAEDYIRYLICFHTYRDYFECHEILEAYWKKHPQSELNKAWVGLIQLAVSLYHQRRNNLIGARKMIDQAHHHLAANDLAKLGIDESRLLTMLINRKKLMDDYPEASFADLDIPIIDRVLLGQCADQCSKLGLAWGSPSNMLDAQLIHKHTLRDRSEVIQTRLMELARRKP